MIVLGDISGIQNYLFDLADEGGGQARRLRARSFFLQVISDLAAIRVMRELGWGFESLRMASAGTFVLHGVAPVDGESRLRRLDSELSAALLGEARGEVRLSLGWSEESGSEAAQYRAARDQLLESKARAWASVAIGDDGWDLNAIKLPPLDTPCALCRHQKAESIEFDDENREIRVCRRCESDGRLGRKLTLAKWLVVRDEAGSTTTETVGLHWELSSAPAPPCEPSVIAVANLSKLEQPPAGLSAGRFWKRRLMCHVPIDADGAPVWFEHIAKQSRGDALLGVFKADADSVGAELEKALQGSTNIRPLSFLSEHLDQFFAKQLRDELESNADWELIYTVFGGGDDLLLVGPWNVMVDFAGRLNQLFQAGLKRRGLTLTLSAGMALTKWKRPIKFAVAQAEELLDLAKTERAPDESESKDQIAAFGQMWKWKHHTRIVGDAKRLVGWVADDSMPRGWLHTLLELAEMRFGDRAAGRAPDPLATARLAHYVSRNYRRGTEVRRWGDQLVNDFDTCERVETRYLPAIVRYALTATRNPSKEH